MIGLAPNHPLAHNPNERRGLVPDMARAGTSEKVVGLGHRVGLVSPLAGQITAKRGAVKARGANSQLDRKHYRNRRRPTVRR